MSDQPLKLLLIVSSVREQRFGPVPARWFAETARQHGRFDVDVLDLAELDLPDELPGSPQDLVGRERTSDLEALRARLADADAFVIVTPEYNHSFPASIKHLIDWHFVEWQAKPVGFVSYGGTGGGLRAVEALRLVLIEMHATLVRDLVSFHKFWELFDEQGRPTDPEAAGAAKKLLDQLSWWARALRDARAATPYAA